MKKANNKLTLIPSYVTLTYNYNDSYNDSYYVDIQVNSDDQLVEAWLFHSKLGIKEFMVEIDYSNTDKDFEDFLELIESNIDEWISDFKEKYY